jgi:hypothetical protein
MSGHSKTRNPRSSFKNKDGVFCFTGLELRQQHRVCENIRIGTLKEKGAKPDYGNFAGHHSICF